MKFVIQPKLLLNPPNGYQRTIDITHIGHLLQSVDRGRTLVSAAKDLNVSYRTIWNELKSAEQELGCQLIERTKGHGSRVTPAGQSIIQCIGQMDSQLSKETERLANDIGQRLTNLLHKPPQKYVFCSSNDPIIEQIYAKFDEIEYKTMGSGHALDRLIENKATLAGFHVSDPNEIKAIEDHLRHHGLVVEPLMQRVQGLIMAKGNPLKIKSIRDLARPEIRIINRQKGAGTRLLLDRLIEREGLKTKQIKGYEHEEFTHSAVATSILAKQADVGIGLQYIAKEYRLHFIALETETFYLAMKPEFRRNKTLIALMKAIQNRSKKTPGYQAV